MKTNSFILATLLIAALAGPIHADALAKLKVEKLQAIHQAVQALQAQRKPVVRTGPYQDFRANVHVHSSLSHDSRGTLEEIVTAAKATGTRVLLFTEHPSEKHDFYLDGHRGLKDGVLLIPGAEMRGFLVFPKQSLRGLDSGSSQEFTNLVRGRGGLVFLSHLEERMDWEIAGLTGTEIYNTHADFKDEKGLIAAMRNPLWIFKAADLFRKYPQESFSALLDYPADYLRRWDELCIKARHTGVAANDSHQNVGLVVHLLEGNKVRVEDALGVKLFETDVGLLPALAALAQDKKVGDVLFQLRLDPYEVSLRHVGTHLLLAEQTEPAVWEALEAGRAYVAFDWLADPAGFDFAAISGSRRFEMGSRVELVDGLRLRAESPLPVHWKIVRNGKTIAEPSGRTLEHPVGEPGNYRVEAWLDIASEKTIWVLSNPVYIQSAKNR